MKALTISEPYASLIVLGEKIVENRTWHTNYRGPLAIHAGKGSQYLSPRKLRNYDTGCVLGTADLVACLAITIIREKAGSVPGELFAPEFEVPLTWLDLAEHEHAHGPYCFVLTNVVKFDKPIPAKGRQGFWDWKNEN